MSRSQVRFAIVLVVLFLLVGVGYRVMVSMRQQRVNEERIKMIAPDLAVTTDQRMQDFRRVKMRDGKKMWEIVARQGRYLQENQEMIVEAPEFSFYPKDGEMIALKSKEAWIYLDSDGREVTRVELKGDLEMRVGDFSIRTQEATFESEQNTIVSAATVQINGPGVAIAGQGYTVDLSGKRMTLNADVKTTVSKGERS